MGSRRWRRREWAYALAVALGTAAGCYDADRGANGEPLGPGHSGSGVASGSGDAAGAGSSTTRGPGLVGRTPGAAMTEGTAGAASAPPAAGSANGAAGGEAVVPERPMRFPDGIVPVQSGTTAVPGAGQRQAHELCSRQMPLSAGDNDGTLGSVHPSAVADSHSYVASDRDGNIVIADSFLGKIDFGNGPQSAHGAQMGLFVAKLDANCELLWANTYGGGASARIEGGPLAVAPDGAIALAGSVVGTVDFGLGDLRAMPGQTNAFLLQLEPDGSTRFAKVFATGELSELYGVGADASGDIVITGFGPGTIRLGDKPLAGLGPFMAKFSARGEHRWSRRLAEAIGHTDLLLTANGEALIGGGTISALDWKDGTPVVSGLGQWWPFMSLLDGAGVHRWSIALDPNASGSGWTYSLDPTGFALVSHGLPPTGSGANARGFERIASDGTLATAYSWDTTAEPHDSTNLAATDSRGNVVALGTFGTRVTLGGTIYDPLGDEDVYLAKRDSRGSVIWSAHEGTDRMDMGLGVATDRDDNTLALWKSYQVDERAPDQLVLVKLAP